jgi:hypothetical protein
MDIGALGALRFLLQSRLVMSRAHRQAQNSSLGFNFHLVRSLRKVQKMGPHQTSEFLMHLACNIPMAIRVCMTPWW